jgi:hypothetical protein
MNAQKYNEPLVIQQKNAGLFLGFTSKISLKFQPCVAIDWSDFSTNQKGQM